MKTYRLIFCSIFCVPLLACGAHVDNETSAHSGSGEGGGGGCASIPATTTTPDCPATPEGNTCTQQGQVCTWKTGSSSVTYTCQMVTDCSPMTYVIWNNPMTTGDGCTRSDCCVPCDQAKPDDPCDALGFQCAYHDTSGGFPPVIGLYCSGHKWTEILECEN